MPSLPPPPVAKVAAPKPGTSPKKTFTIKEWTDEGQGTKICIYGPEGMGKTTLASMAPRPVFIGLDDGGRKIRNPKTGKPVQVVAGLDSFADLRDVSRFPDLIRSGQTVVIDTITKAQALAEEYTFATVMGPQNTRAKSLEDYGYGKGYRFLMESMRLLLSDLDGLVRRGVNILLLAQQGQGTVSNLEGTDYLIDCPKLHNMKSGEGVRAEVCEWCDHVFRIGHPDLSVFKANKDAQKGKASGSTERIIYTKKEVYFAAKSRPVNGQSLPDTITFSEPGDDSLWQFLFPTGV